MDFENKLVVTGGGGKGLGGRDGLGVWDRHVHTAIHKIDNQQGPTVYHRERCSLLYSDLDIL